MHELVEHPQDTIEALKREIVRNPKRHEYRKALKSIGERLAIRGGVTAINEGDGPRKTPTKSFRFHRRKIITSHL